VDKKGVEIVEKALENHEFTVGKKFEEIREEKE